MELVKSVTNYTNSTFYAENFTPSRDESRNSHSNFKFRRGIQLETWPLIVNEDVDQTGLAESYGHRKGNEFLITVKRGSGKKRIQ